MDTKHNSSSHEQMHAEDEMFALVEKKLNIKLQKNPKIYLADNAFTYIQPDFYSEGNLVVGEIFAHIGKNKTGQDKKIAADILKMLLLDKVTGKAHRKIIAVCDTVEKNKLSGLSYIAESIRQFDIEVMHIEISDELRNQLMEAQKRQYR